MARAIQHKLVSTPKGCVEGDRAAAVWCKTIIDHHHHIAAVTVAASQLSRTHGSLESLEWVAIRWAVTSPAIVQQRTRYLADYENDEVYANICLHLLRNGDGEVDDGSDANNGGEFSVPRLLSRETWETIYSARPLRIYDSMGDDLFVENKQLKLTLVKDIDENQLPEVYEGNLQLAPIQGCLGLDFTAGLTGDWICKMLD
ncbi:hypothetical protein Tco_1406472 [Tanacetum coccineum]